jgi:hypothetical protein
MPAERERPLRFGLILMRAETTVVGGLEAAVSMLDGYNQASVGQERSVVSTSQ